LEAPSDDDRRDVFVVIEAEQQTGPGLGSSFND
jgi:hypothetical protein